MDKRIAFILVLSACVATDETTDVEQSLDLPNLPPTPPIRLPPSIGPEIGMDTPSAVVAQGAQEAPAVACSPTICLGVWEDKRSKPGNWWVASDPDIYGARFSIGGGGPLEPFDIAISTAEGRQGSPSVAFDGTNFVVVWEDSRDDGLDIWGARVTTTGTVLDPAGLPIVVASGSQSSPKIAANGAQRFVVWEDTRGDGNDIAGGLVSATGALVSSAWIAFAPHGQRNPAVAGIAPSVGGGFFVVWDDERLGVPAGPGFERDVFGVRVSLVGGPTGFAVPISTATGDQFDAVLAISGATGVVAWSDHRSGAFQVVGTGLNTITSVVAHPSGFVIDADPSESFDPAIGAGGGSFRVAFRRDLVNRDLFSRPVSSGGGAFWPAVAHGTADVDGAAVGCTSVACAVAWTDARNDVWTGWNIRDIYVQNSNGLGTAAALSVAANGEIAPDVAFDGSHYFVVWMDFRNTNYGDIYGVRLDATGAVIDPAPIAICTDPGDQGAPQVAFDGTDFVVVWHDNRTLGPPTAGPIYDIRGTRVSTAGVVANPDGLLVYSAPYDQLLPRIACGATGQCLVAWHDHGIPGNTDVRGLRWTAAGVLDPAGIAIATTASDEEYPAVGWNGTNYLVAFDRPGSGIFAGTDIYAARVLVDGTIPVANGVDVVAASGEQTHARVAYGGGTWMLAWDDERVSDGVTDIYGGRVSSLGLAVDGTGFPVGVELGNQTNATLAYDGSHFLIAWTDERNGNKDVYATRVSASGIRVGGDGNAYAIQLQEEQAPALASDGAGHWLLAFARFLHAPTAGATRVRTGLVTNH